MTATATSTQTQTVTLHVWPCGTEWECEFFHSATMHPSLSGLGYLNVEHQAGMIASMRKRAEELGLRMRVEFLRSYSEARETRLALLEAR